jgi:hypothetical protein
MTPLQGKWLLPFRNEFGGHAVEKSD